MLLNCQKLLIIAVELCVFQNYLNKVETGCGVTWFSDSYLHKNKPIKIAFFRKKNPLFWISF